MDTFLDLGYEEKCVKFYNKNSFFFSQPNQLQVLQQLQIPQLQQQELELQLQASRTTVPPGLSTTDSRLPTMDREGRRLDRQLLHSRDNR